MTRENKLALIVGFGLILFVGILISDHFSTVRNQAAANFASVVDPLVDSPSVNGSDPSLVDLQNPQTHLSPAIKPTSLVRVTEISPTHETPSAEQRSVISMPDLLAPSLDEQVTSSDVHQISIAGFVPVEEPAIARVEGRIHVVSKGESMFAICRRYYDDTSLARALASVNGLQDPAKLEVGTHLRIPPIETLGGAPSPSKPRTYTVRSGDSLSKIAKSVLGSEMKWHQLYQHNKKVIDDPDRLKVGTVLTLPG